MTTIWERVVSALTGLGLPLAANVWLAATAAEIPDAYISYFLVTSPPLSHADNAEMVRSYVVQVTYYSRAGLAGMPDIPAAMTAAGFTAGARRELPYNQQTRHYGLAMDFVYVD